jgi:hypothetical protein
MLTQKILMKKLLIDLAIHKRLSNNRKTRFCANRRLCGNYTETGSWETKVGAALLLIDCFQPRKTYVLYDFRVVSQFLRSCNSL